MVEIADLAKKVLAAINDAIDKGEIQNQGHDINHPELIAHLKESGQHFPESAPQHPGVTVSVDIPYDGGKDFYHSSVTRNAFDAANLVRSAAYKQGLDRAGLPVGRWSEADLQTNIPENGFNLRVGMTENNSHMSFLATFTDQEALHKFRASSDGIEAELSRPLQAAMSM